MIYPLAAVTLAMSGYMVWLLVFRLRRDRVRAERDRTRGKFVLRPRERLRFLLHRSFAVSDERPEWEDRLVSGLSGVDGQLGATADNEASVEVGPPVANVGQRES